MLARDWKFFRFSNTLVFLGPLLRKNADTMDILYMVLQLQFSVNTLPSWELGKWIVGTQIDEKDQISILTQFDGSYDMEEQKNVVKAKMMCNFSEEFVL